jgi:hypothetical protein
MIGRKSVIGIAVLCALAVSAFAAASASAEQRAYTCDSSAAVKEFKDAHCLTKVESGATVGHTLLPETSTAITGTNANTTEETKAAAVSKLLGALSGVVTEVQCTTLGGTGSLTNAAASVSGTGTIEYTGCTVTKPAGKGCVVTGGAVTTKELSATTAGQAANKLKFTPKEGTEFATVPIEKCETASLNNKFPVTGSLIADTSGATTTTTHAGVTTQNTLKFGGVKAGIEGALTISTSGGSPVTLT